MRAAQIKAQREARARSRRRASRVRAVLAAAALLLVIVACVLLYESPLFAVERVEVVGVSHVTTQHVLQLADVPKNATLLRFPGSQVAARVETDPWVASVVVSRVFPNGMRIRVTERVPAAVVVVAPASLWLIDGNGFVIASASVTATASLPAVEDVPGLDLAPGRRTVSEPLLNALKVLTGITPRLRGMVVSVSAPTIDGTTLLTRSHVEIVFGEAVDLATKDQLAQTILAQQSGRVVSIDVRSTGSPTWRGIP